MNIIAGGGGANITKYTRRHGNATKQISHSWEDTCQITGIFKKPSWKMNMLYFLGIEE
jgi:hypothetical protein